MRAEPERYELHFQDETHLETNPYLTRTWHRRGQQATLPGVGTNRRVTVFGSVEALGRARLELVRVAQDSAGFLRYLELLEAHHQQAQREIHLVLDNGSAHTSLASLQALAARSAWLHIHWLAKYAPQLNPKEREWRQLKRDARSHAATSLRTFVDDIVSGLSQCPRTIMLRMNLVMHIPIHLGSEEGHHNGCDNNVDHICAVDLICGSQCDNNVDRIRVLLVTIISCDHQPCSYLLASFGLRISRCISDRRSRRYRG